MNKYTVKFFYKKDEKLAGIVTGKSLEEIKDIVKKNIKKYLHKDVFVYFNGKLQHKSVAYKFRDEISKLGE